MQVDTGFILAAGAGSRMNCAYGHSKPMCLVGGKHLLRYGIDAMLGAGIKNIHVVYSQCSRDVLRLSAAYPQVTFHLQQEVSGSLSSLKFVAERADAPFLLLDGDIVVTPRDLRIMLRSVPQNSSFDMFMAVCDRDVFGMERSVILGVDGSIGSYRKAASTSKDGSHHQAVPGGMAYLWMKPLLEDIANISKQTNSMSDFLSFVTQHYRIGAMHIDCLWDVDCPDDIQKTEKLFQTRGMQDGKEKPKILFLDIDETVVSHSGNLKREIIDCTRRAAQDGTAIAICTARSPFTTKPIADKLACNAIICAEGSLVIKDNQTIHSVSFDREKGVAIIEAAREADRELECSVLACDEEYSRGTVSEVLKSKTLNGKWLRILLYGAGDSLNESFLPQLKQLGLRTSVLESGDVLVQSSNAGKLAGMSYVLEASGLRFEEAAYIGDWVDDLPCIAQSGFGVATSKAPSHVKEFARYVCPAGNDGIAKQIDILLGR